MQRSGRSRLDLPIVADERLATRALPERSGVVPRAQGDLSVL